MMTTKLTQAIAPRSAFVVPTLGCTFGSIEGFGAGYAVSMRERHVDAVLATPGTHAWRPPIT